MVEQRSRRVTRQRSQFDNIEQCASEHGLFLEETPIGTGRYTTVYPGVFDGQNIAAKVLTVSDSAEQVAFNTEVELTRKASDANVGPRFVTAIRCAETVSGGRRPLFYRILVTDRLTTTLDRYDWHTLGVSSEEQIRLLLEALLRDLHEQNIAHCDIRASNIGLALDAAGKIERMFLLDFGLSKDLSLLTEQEAAEHLRLIKEALVQQGAGYRPLARSLFELDDEMASHIFDER